MPNYTERFSEVCCLLGQIRGANSAAELNSGYVSVANYHRVVVMIYPVSLGSALDVDIEQGTDTSGSGVKTVDSGNKDITVAQTDTTPSIIEIRTEELDVTGGFDCINVEVTPTVGSYYFAAIWGFVPRFAPVSTSALDSVTD